MLSAIKSGSQVIFTFGLLFYNIAAFGQAPQGAASPSTNDSVAVRQFPNPDAFIVSDTSALSTTYPLEEDTYQKHSPAKATIMSAVVPGLGQIYNRKVWKVPIVYAALGTTVYIFLKWQNEYQRHRRAYIDFKDGDPTTNYYKTVVPPQYLASGDANIDRYVSYYKDLYHRWRDWSILALVVVYMANVIDANVDAHFFDYSIDDDISLNIRPCFLGNGGYSQNFGLTLCFTF